MLGADTGECYRSRADSRGAGGERVSPLAAMGLARLVVLAALAALASPVPHRRVKRIVGGTEADPPAQAPPAVLVYEEGEYVAAVTGTRLDGYVAFEGIRYAEPPVCEYRFQRARRLRLEGEVDATRPGAPCPQPGPAGGDQVVGSEDCLLLNVYAPRSAPGDEAPPGLPVMVWIHGGGFRRGSAAQYGPGPLVRKGLVLVPVQYRLGSLGFLSSANREVPGNMGLFDIALAVEWVKEYIGHFGGDPRQITLAGQGSGGSIATLMTLSSFTNGSVSRVAALSGTPLSSFAVDKSPAATGRSVAESNGCPETPALEMVRCLQALPVEKLVRTDSLRQDLEQGIVNSLADPLGSAPVVDGEDDRRSLPGLVRMSPLDALRSSEYPDIPLLTGVTAAETGTAISGKYRDEVVAESSSIPGFWSSALQGLTKKSGVELFSNVNNDWLSTWTTGYQSILQGGGQGSQDVLSRLIEATGDALFNVQAFEMAEFWAKKSKRTYLYSFDHQGAERGGPLFLAGLPLVAQGGRSSGQPASRGPAHGDDLLYLFDALPLTGRSGAATPTNLTHPDDVRVRDIYTDLVAQFVKTGSPRLPGGQQGAWPSFQDSTSAFLRISPSPQVLGGFRYCQMALWTGLVSRLQDPACAGIQGVEKIAQNFVSVLGSTTATIFDSVTSLANLTGLLPSFPNILTGGGLQNLLPGGGVPNLIPGGVPNILPGGGVPNILPGGGVPNILPGGNRPISIPLLQPVQGASQARPRGSVQTWPPKPGPRKISLGDLLGPP
ncbi:carboxylic ester hydrolase [Bacillus rossius redtenbacheri]|uniref:carboxylic ester hydrolase n=1 Tax=Bacillus rossius redtenbacheri TaxID=93214 RepID=UPI002FDE4815